MIFSLDTWLLPAIALLRLRLIWFLSAGSGFGHSTAPSRTDVRVSLPPSVSLMGAVSAYYRFVLDGAPAWKTM